MELKYRFLASNQCEVLTFNRTAYGIEIVHRAFRSSVRFAFNRTAYGIEMKF